MDSGNGELNDHLKVAHSLAPSGVTGKVNMLHELITARKSADVIWKAQVELKKFLDEFRSAHEAFHHQLENETERETSSQYYNSLMELATELERDLLCLQGWRKVLL